MDDNKRRIDDINRQIDEMMIEILKSAKSSDSLSSEERRKQALDGIKSGGIDWIYSWDDISLTDLLSVDENNISYLEYAYRNKVHFLQEIKQDIFSNYEALCICATRNIFDWVNYIGNEDMYFEKRLDGKSLIDYIFENNLKTYFGFYSLFKKNVEIVDYIVKYDKHRLFDLSPEIIKLLLTKQNGKYPIDKYINIPQMKRVIFRKDYYKDLLEYCQNTNNYALLKDANEELLLYDMGNGKKVIELLLDKGIEPSFYGYDFKSYDILKILVERDRIDLLYKADVTLLLSIYDGNRTFLDLMFEKQREGVDVHLEKMSFAYYSLPSEMTAKLLIKLAQNNFQGFVPSIDKKMLLFREANDKRSVLEHLIDIDRELTISKIISRCPDRYAPGFVLVLKNLGIEDRFINFKAADAKFSDLYIDEYNERYAKNSVSVCPELLDELKNLFYQDGISDKAAIDCLIISYTYLTSEESPNKEMFVQEIKHLIDIKKNNYDKFTYTKIDNGAYFRPGGGVCLDNNVISTINHETSHALHYYLASDYVPENYFEVISRARSSEGMIDRVGEYSKRIAQLRESIRSDVSKSKIEEYYKNLYQGDKLLELSLFLAKSKEEQKAELIRDYNEQVLDVILARTYSVDDFIKQRIEIEVCEIVDATLRNDYDALIAIGDIIDAIYMGKFKNGALFDENGLEIKPAYGHGISYYNDKIHDHGFDEMIANYGSIIKSQNSEEILIYLRSIVGDEVVDMIKNVYENYILRLQTYEQKVEMEDRDRAR